MMLTDLYLRLSDGRNENGSFADRENALRARASTLGWTVHRVVVENDLMNGSKSASAFKRRKIGVDANGKPIMRVWRPGFRSILDDLSAGTVQAVLAEDLDRAMRDPRDGEDMIDVVMERKAWADSLSGSLRFTAGGSDSEITMARMMVAMGWKSSRDTARRVREGRERQATHGIWGGGRRPYGFTPTPNPTGSHQNTQLVVNDTEAAVIRRCADQVLTETFGTRGGNSLRSIAKDLRDRGVPTVTGTRWTAASLRDILLRPLNAGIVVYDGQETAVRLPGEPILHEDVLRAVVAKLTDPARSTPGRAPCWLGTGLYRCVCGSTMEILAGANRAKSYRCSRDGGTGDVHTRRNAAQLDGYVEAVLIERLGRPDVVDLVAKPKTAGVDMKELRRQVKALKELRAEIMRDRDEGLIDRAEMTDRLRRNKSKLEKIEAQLTATTDASPLAPVIGAADVAEVWQRLSLGQRRAILATVLVITVLPAVRRGVRGFNPASVRVDPAN